MLIYILLLAWCIAEVVYFGPQRRAKLSNAAFDGLVLGVIDGLILEGAPVPLCTADLRSYVLRQLHSAHGLPSGQTLINYKAANGYKYCSLTGNGDNALFAVLCLVRYACDTGNQELLDWCETHLEPARRNGSSYNTFL